MTKTQTPAIDLSLPLDAQPSIAVLLAELGALQPALEQARQTLAEAEHDKKRFFARAAEAGYGSLAGDDDLALAEFNVGIEAALRQLKQVQAQVADTEFRLGVERQHTRQAMCEAMMATHRDWMLSLAEVLEQVDLRMQLAAQVLGVAASKFPSGLAPVGPQLLQGSNRQIAAKLRKAAAAD
jgi:hypothetical protein